MSDTGKSSGRNFHNVEYTIKGSEIGPLSCRILRKWDNFSPLLPVQQCCAVLKSLSHVQLFATPQTVATRLLCPWGFSRQGYWSGSSRLPLGDLPNPRIEPRSPALQVDSLPAEPAGKPKPCIQANDKQKSEFYSLCILLCLYQPEVTLTHPHPMLIICVPHLLFIITFYMIRNFFLFFATLQFMQNLSSPNRDRTSAPCNGSTEASPGPPRKSQKFLLIF